MNTHAQPLTIKAALEKGIQTARQCPEHKRNQEKAAALLTDFMEHHGIIMWDELRMAHIREYVALLEARGLSPNTMRAYTNPLRLAYKINRDDVGAEFLKLRGILPKRTEADKMYLTPAQIRYALRQCDKYAERAGYFCLSLGALAGLRITEAAALTPDDYDAAHHTITVGNKNAASKRVIPLCKAAADLIEWQFSAPRRNRRDEGKPYCTTYVSKSIRRILDGAFERTNNDCYVMVKPRDAGRKSFMNALNEYEVSPDIIRAYCGQAPPQWDVLHRNYVALIPKPTGPPHIREACIKKLEKTVVRTLEKYF